MKIELASAHQILVELNAADLGAFHLTVEQLDAPNEDTRRVLQQILLAAAGTTGDSYSLRQYSNVDVLPDKVGGCLLILSDYEKRHAQPLLYFRAEDFDPFVDLARALGAAGKTIPVTLLEGPQGFLLVSPPLREQQRRVFAEYLRPVRLPHGALWVLREHGRVLLDRKPLSVLGGGS